MNQFLLPCGDRHKYSALYREIFWDTLDNGLFIWDNNKWVFLCGSASAADIVAKKNIEIQQIDNKRIIRLKDDIDINSIKLGKWYIQKEVANESGFSVDVDIIIQTEDDVRFKANDVIKTLRDTKLSNTSNHAGSKRNRWYELSMKDFREMTGLPLVTGSKLDLFDNNSYMYWDIYVYHIRKHFSVDRVFITHNKCDKETDIISGGRIFVHQVAWITVYDNHYIDISDGFILPELTFNSKPENNTYVKGVPTHLMSVFKTIPGGIVSSKTILNPYPRWKGSVKLGEVQKSTFFPLLTADPGIETIIGGQFLIQTTRDDKTVRDHYTAALCSNNKCKIAGCSENRDKYTIDMVYTKTGKMLLGFHTFQTSKKELISEQTQIQDVIVATNVYLQIWSREGIRLVSNNRGMFFTFRDDIDDSTNPNDDEYGYHWYEMSMRDFRRILKIPLTTGSKLDQFDNSCFIYFDIYINENDEFSISRIFITTESVTTEDRIVSEGRVWCHSSDWMPPNDQHTVDVSDAFIFLSSVFNGVPIIQKFIQKENIEIMKVFITGPEHDTTIIHENITYKPPEKIEVWFNGWEDRKNTVPALDITENDLMYARILAKD